ncbi:MAG: long-chain fatty acid--CoA ligase [Deltaproteobacteria bacterium HGW-Deltaproteobacteria-21]|nr:MAG: long-chain fatty acid--CoA ligase [Deltaproteobacteria bacterium HGW-Deltaproteobacteria-21]
MRQEKHNIWSAFEETANRRGRHTAVIYLGTRFSYARLKELAEKFAGALANLGVQPGERVVLYLPNTIQWVVAWLGTQRADAVCLPITPIYTPHDLKYIANDGEAETIVCADTNFGYVKRVLPETKVKRVIVTQMADLLPWWKRAFGYLADVVPSGKIAFSKDIHSFAKLMSGARPPTAAAPSRQGRDVAEILYTGGTTKYPKGVPLTHALFLVSMDEQIRVPEPLFPIEENVILGNAPLFHILGQTCSLSILLVGGTLMIQPRVNLDATFDSIQRFKAKTMIGVPTLYRMMLEHDRIDQYDLSSVDYWYSAGDVLPVEVGKRWSEKFGKDIYQGYGATETCGGITMCPTNVKNPAKSVGRVVPSKKIKLVDPATLQEVKRGEPGELLVSSEHMVTGYINKPEETASSFVQLEERLWYRTADILSMDEEGNLYFVDRTVDTIKHKGYRVSASEIEAVLQEHPAVVGSCVVGVPDEKVGERIKAYVVLKADIKGITGYDLIKWCRKQLVSYKVPQYIEFRDMLPKSKVGKLLRREIRDEEKRRAQS